MTESGKSGDIEKARTALTEARRLRGKWFLAVAEGRASVEDLIVAADQPGGEPLKRLTLIKVLAAQPEWTKDRAERVVQQTVGGSMSTAHTRRPKEPIHLSWLLDVQARHTRLVAFTAAMSPRDRRPTPRFPYDALSPPTG